MKRSAVAEQHINLASGCMRSSVEIRHHHPSIMRSLSGPVQHWVNQTALWSAFSAQVLLPSDDAASPPHQCNATIVNCPAKFFGCLSQQHETLSIGDNLGGIECLEREIRFREAAHKL